VGLACAKLGRDASRERVGFPLPLRERTDRAQRDQVRAEHAPRPRASPGAPLRAAPPSPARGEGKIARAARAENFHCNEKPASENVWTSRKLLRRVEACAPSTTPLGWSASPAVAVAEEHCACVARTNSITRPGPRTRHAIVRRLGGLEAWRLGAAVCRSGTQRAAVALLGCEQHKNMQPFSSDRYVRNFTRANELIRSRWGLYWSAGAGAWRKSL
jgi:hypothetical protein